MSEVFYNLRDALMRNYQEALKDAPEYLKETIITQPIWAQNRIDRISCEISLSEQHYDFKDFQPIAGFSLTTLPGNGEIFVSNGVWVNYKLRGQGIGSFLHKFRLDCAKRASVKSLLCTVNNWNNSEEAILRKNNWTEISSLSSSCKLFVKKFFGETEA